MDFFLFVLVNAALFIRPGEIAPGLAGVPIYQALILACLIVSLPRIWAQWSRRPLAERPITAAMLLLLVAVVMSHVAHGDIGLAQWYGLDFARVVLYYILFVAVTGTPARLRGLLTWLLVFIVAIATLALCQYHNLVDLPALRPLERFDESSESDEGVYILQLVGTGIFNDPNDFALLLAFGCLISLWLAADRGFGLPRVAWSIPLGVLGYAILLTQSRGGLLALAAGVMTWMASLVRARWVFIAVGVAGPLSLPLLGGRLARMSIESETAQQRIHLWYDALEEFRGAPIFGIGTNTLEDRIGLVAHNSFVQAFAEMGLLGGMTFIAAFVMALLILRPQGRRDVLVLDDQLSRMRPYLLASVVTFSTGLYSLTRCYVISTYLPLALAESFQLNAVRSPSDAGLRLNPRLLAMLGGVGLASLVAIWLFVRVFIR